MDTVKNSLQVDLINIFSEISILSLYIKNSEFRQKDILEINFAEIDIDIIRELLKIITYVKIDSQIYSFKMVKIFSEENDVTTVILGDLK